MGGLLSLRNNQAKAGTSYQVFKKNIESIAVYSLQVFGGGLQHSGEYEYVKCNTKAAQLPHNHCLEAKLACRFKRRFYNLKAYRTRLRRTTFANYFSKEPISE